MRSNFDSVNSLSFKLNILRVESYLLKKNLDPHVKEITDNLTIYIESFCFECSFFFFFFFERALSVLVYTN
jgi:hypothetical protein